LTYSEFFVIGRSTITLVFQEMVMAINVVLNTYNVVY
jgi:hypothetical protein